METKTRAFQIHADDNVATLIDDLETPGEVRVLGGFGRDSVRVPEAVRAGHKVALTEINEGSPVIKFGVPIGRASTKIGAGAWVHLHNLVSEHDERSGTLDRETGVSTDVAYE